MRPEFDVVICGAGPAGLTLAVELARRGVAFVVVDRAARPFPGSRGRGVQPRTQEIFEDLGILDAVAAAGSVYPSKRLYGPDGSHVDVPLVDAVAPTPAEPYGMPLLVPQFATEAALRARLLELGHEVRWQTTLEAFQQDADRVTVTLRDPDGVRTLGARYLVGTDGGRSTVRHALGVGFPGTALGMRALVADVRVSGLSRDAWHSFNETTIGNMLTICPLPGTDLFSLLAPAPPDGETDLSAPALAALVAARSGRGDIRVHDVRWASVYGMSARLAERYRIGRVLLAGDAAHVHPPAGGQGLNTSVQDAYNLGWKLAAALRCAGTDAETHLLDSYEAERRPIGAGMLDLSVRLLEAATHGNFRRGREVRQLDLAYADSPLALHAPGYGGRIAAGQRAPDAPLMGAAGQPVRLFKLFKGTHWTLLAWDTGMARLAALRRPGLHLHAIGPEGDLRDRDGHAAAAYGLRPGEAVLVRPDGYVGATLRLDADGATAALVDYLHKTIH